MCEAEIEGLKSSWPREEKQSFRAAPETDRNLRMLSARGLDLSAAISDRILMLDIKHDYTLFP